MRRSGASMPRSRSYLALKRQNTALMDSMRRPCATSTLRSPTSSTRNRWPQPLLCSPCPTRRTSLSWAASCRSRTALSTRARSPRTASSRCDRASRQHREQSESSVCSFINTCSSFSPSVAASSGFQGAVRRIRGPDHVPRGARCCGIKRGASNIVIDPSTQALSSRARATFLRRS